MTDDLRRRALRQARIGFAMCVFAVVAATLAWINGMPLLFGVNCFMFGACAVLTHFSYEMSRP